MKYKFLIYISYSYSIPVGEPLEQEILKRGDHVKWFCDTEEGKVKLFRNSNLLTTIKQAVNYKPDIVLSITNSVPDFIRGIKVQVFHWFYAKKRVSKINKFSHFKIRGFYDLYCTQGPSTTHYFKELSQLHGYFNVQETGWPKVDGLFKQSDNQEHARNNILISSTFTKSLSLAYDDSFYHEIKALIRTRKYNFHMILHPKIPSQIVKKWKKLTGKHFTYFNTTDLNPILLNNALMISDTSSVISEFLLLKRPVIAYKSPIREDHLINVDASEDLAQSIEDTFQLNHNLLLKIEDYIQELHPYQDGKSSQRVIDASIEYLHKDRSNIPAKPLNLFRKIKIRFKLRYMTFKSYS
ncbi:MAG: CDP-glycerol glycerophosphotransferase family protein, partial [Marinicellaceae bacterium]